MSAGAGLRIEVARHTWISNAAFYRMTGIRYVCLDCRIGVAAKRDAPRDCPGARSVEAG